MRRRFPATFVRRGGCAGVGRARIRRRERIVEPRPSAAGNMGYKRSFDLVLLGVAGILLAPLWVTLLVAVAVAIRLDDGGPVFYAQRRLGRGGRPFEMFKFRTMVECAERDSGPVLSSADDPRVTRVGAVLRRLHIDELPQAVNIARGDMSWVGPRPERPEIAARIEARLPAFADRLAVPPGIAGLGQLRRFNNPETSESKLRHDRIYIAKMGPWLDLWLIVLCIGKTLAAEARRLQPSRPGSERPRVPRRSREASSGRR